MKRLDDIPKKNVFEAPEGYFESLPLKLQQRLQDPEPASRGWAWLPRIPVAIRIAVPVGAIAMLVWVGIALQSPDQTPEEVLASLPTESLVAYLDDSDLNTDDLLEVIQLDDAETSALEMNAMGDAGLDEQLLEQMEKESRIN